VKEESEALSKVRPVTGEGGPLFLRFKGAGGLDPRSLAVLEAVLQFREKVARRRDCPPFKVLGNAPILEMAKRKPLTASALKAVGGISAEQVRALGPSLLKKIQGVLDLHVDALPVYPRKVRQPLGHEVALRIKAFKKWREKCALRLAIEPSLVLTNQQIHSLARAYPAHPRQIQGINGVKNWQEETLGRDICKVLRGVG
jgi:ribonuclease D